MLYHQGGIWSVENSFCSIRQQSQTHSDRLREADKWKWYRNAFVGLRLKGIRKKSSSSSHSPLENKDTCYLSGDLRAISSFPYIDDVKLFLPAIVVIFYPQLQRQRPSALKTFDTFPVRLKIQDMFKSRSQVTSQALRPWGILPFLLKCMNLNWMTD